MKTVVAVMKKVKAGNSRLTEKYFAEMDSFIEKQKDWEKRFESSSGIHIFRSRAGEEGRFNQTN